MNRQIKIPREETHRTCEEACKRLHDIKFLSAGHRVERNVVDSIVFDFTNIIELNFLIVRFCTFHISYISSVLQKKKKKNGTSCKKVSKFS